VPLFDLPPAPFTKEKTYARKRKPMSDRTILDALDLISTAYPNEKTAIWVQCTPGQSDIEFTAAVGAGSADVSPEFAYGRTATEAAERLIAKAGDRDPVKLLDAKIEKLRTELATLQAKAQPQIQAA
jgi:hypothetical protein